MSKNKKYMLQKELFREVEYRMEAEGFHYCFESYSDFSEIEEEKFHLLRKQYLKAVKELENYVLDKSK